jgi:UDP-3-O-[3-hydroxymyristoyl] glucosamine N-acyltransferase
MQVSFTVAQILDFVAATTIRGATSVTVSGIASLAEAAPGDLSFLGNPKYKGAVAATRASVVLLPEGFHGEPQPDQLFVLVPNPSVALARICARLEQGLWPAPLPGVHGSASVSPSAQVAASATVGPLCVVEAGAVIAERVHLQAQVFVGRNARILEDSWLMPGVVVAAECTLGRRVRVQPGVVIGSDGFGYEFVDGHHEKVPQVGRVEIGDDVEIGANSTIDRARFGRTVIGEGTKIDNLVQIAHNVMIGRHCLLCAQVGISGSATLGDFVVLGGQAGTSGHVTIGRGVKAGGRAGITTDVAAGSFVNGNPAIPYLLERRIVVLQHRLPELFKRLSALESRCVDAKKTSSGAVHPQS